MTAQPEWESTDDYTHDLLELVAMGSPSTGTADAEWSDYCTALRAVAMTNGGVINPNELRPLVRDRVAPRRIGAFANKALALGLVEYNGQWQTSNDTAGRNGGKPARCLLWIGGQL